MIPSNLVKLAELFLKQAQMIYDDYEGEETRARQVREEFPHEVGKFHQALLEMSPQHQREQELEHEVKRFEEIAEWLKQQDSAVEKEKRRILHEQYNKKHPVDDHIDLEEFDI